MKKYFNKFIWLAFVLLLISGLTACQPKSNEVGEPNIEINTEIVSEDKLDENGVYYLKDDVANYLKTFGKLPKNYITKSEAKKLGWIASEGNLQDVYDNGVIGGDKFGNREGLLPKGKVYYECDVNYTGGRRGAERIVYTEDGDIYYTADHYKSFEELK